MFVLYSKVGHKGREQVLFLILESWLELTYNFHLGADTGISNTSTSIASCYSLNSCKGCYKPPEAAITKLKKKHRQRLRSITGHVGLPPSHILISPFQCLAPVLLKPVQFGRKKRKTGKSRDVGSLNFKKYEGEEVLQ